MINSKLRNSYIVTVSVIVIGRVDTELKTITASSSNDNSRATRTASLVVLDMPKEVLIQTQVKDEVTSPIYRTRPFMERGELRQDFVNAYPIFSLSNPSCRCSTYFYKSASGFS